MGASSSAIQDLKSELCLLKQAGLFRQRRCIDSAQGPTVSIHGREVLNFSSNDYLGLANDPRLIEALHRASVKYGVGSGASPLICGRTTAHLELEQEIANITGRDRALIFSTGYMANLALVTGLCPSRRDVIIQDRLNHASMIDGALMSPATLKRYQHTDCESLVRILKLQTAHRKLVLTDCVFSMDGDIAPLAEISKIAKEHKACLAVDDAHGFGILGRNGTGTLEHFDLDQNHVPLLMATFGKALGVFGAFLAGPEAYIETLIQRARPYIYSTAMPSALALTVLESLQLMAQEPWRREQLNSLIKRFRKGAESLGLPIKASMTPIQPLIIGKAKAAVEMSEKLFQHGILVPAIRPPTVPKKSSRLRITLTAAHSDRQVDQLLYTLSKLAIV